MRLKVIIMGNDQTFRKNKLNSLRQIHQDLSGLSQFQTRPKPLGKSLHGSFAKALKQSLHTHAKPTRKPPESANRKFQTQPRLTFTQICSGQQKQSCQSKAKALRNTNFLIEPTNLKYSFQNSSKIETIPANQILDSIRDMITDNDKQNQCQNFSTNKSKARYTCSQVYQSFDQNIFCQHSQRQELAQSNQLFYEQQPSSKLKRLQSSPQEAAKLFTNGIEQSWNSVMSDKVKCSL